LLVGSLHPGKQLIVTRTATGVAAVHAQEELAAGYESSLAQRAVVAATRQYASHVDVSIDQAVEKAFSLLVTADCADERDTSAQACEVGCSVTGPSWGIELLSELHDWDRRFPTQALRAAVDQFVEHDVADHGDSQVTKTLDQW
jgi:hypothetical protein